MFKVGQEVFSATHGKGVVTEVVNMLMYYPVLVEFDSGIQEVYTFDGRLYIHDMQTDLVVISEEKRSCLKLDKKCLVQHVVKVL